MSGKKEICEFVLQHGWGLSSSCYDEWQNILKEKGHIVKVPDRGYFGYKNRVKSFETDCKKILVSHSFGLYLFEKKLLDQADCLIIISGFKGFHPQEKKEKRRSSILMRLMKKKILKEPHKLLTDFYNGHNLLGDKDLNPDVELLHHDLKAIDEDEPDIKRIEKINNVLILQGKNDMVVPLSRAVYLHESINNSELFLFDNADHALPFTKTEETIELILNFIIKGEVVY